MVEAVVRLAASTSPPRLVIGEGAAGYYTPSVFRVHNVYDLVSRYRAECVDLNWDEGVSIAVPEELGRNRVILHGLHLEFFYSGQTLAPMQSYMLRPHPVIAVGLGIPVEEKWEFAGSRFCSCISATVTAHSRVVAV